MTSKKLVINFDASNLIITSPRLARSFVHAFRDEINQPVPNLEIFRTVSAEKLLTWLEFQFLNNRYWTDDECYWLRQLHLYTWNNHLLRLSDPHFRILTNDITGITTVRSK